MLKLLINNIIYIRMVLIFGFAPSHLVNYTIIKQFELNLVVITHYVINNRN